MSKCQCIKPDGQQCSRDASQKPNTNTNFCWQHQTCTKISTKKTTIPLKKQSVEKIKIPIKKQSLTENEKKYLNDQNISEQDYFAFAKIPIITHEELDDEPDEDEEYIISEYEISRSFYSSVKLIIKKEHDEQRMKEKELKLKTLLESFKKCTTKWFPTKLIGSGAQSDVFMVCKTAKPQECEYVLKFGNEIEVELNTQMGDLGLSPKVYDSFPCNDKIAIVMEKNGW